MTEDNPDRLKLHAVPGADFEQRWRHAVRGKIFSVSGRQSLNIRSSRDAIRILRDAITAARGEMQKSFALVVPETHTKRDMVCLIADAERGHRMQDESDALAVAGEQLAATVWPAEDFSDWPGYED